MYRSGVLLLTIVTAAQIRHDQGILNLDCHIVCGNGVCEGETPITNHCVTCPAACACNDGWTGAFCDEPLPSTKEALQRQKDKEEQRRASACAGGDCDEAEAQKMQAYRDAYAQGYEAGQRQVQTRAQQQRLDHRLLKLAQQQRFLKHTLAELSEGSEDDLIGAAATEKPVDVYVTPDMADLSIQAKASFPAHLFGHGHQSNAQLSLAFPQQQLVAQTIMQMQEEINRLQERQRQHAASANGAERGWEDDARGSADQGGDVPMLPRVIVVNSKESVPQLRGADVMVPFPAPPAGMVLSPATGLVTPPGTTADILEDGVSISVARDPFGVLRRSWPGARVPVLGARMLPLDPSRRSSLDSLAAASVNSGIKQRVDMGMGMGVGVGMDVRMGGSNGVLPMPRGTASAMSVGFRPGELHGPLKPIGARTAQFHHEADGADNVD